MLARYDLPMCSLGSSNVLVRGGSAETARVIASTLSRFGDRVLAFADARKIRIVPLAPRQRYADASAALRRLGVDVDRWPVAPAGLFGDDR